MCLIFVAHRIHPRYPIIIAANRDEFYVRPTAGACFWTEAPEVLAGRDLKAGGTWLGVTRQGRFAAVTNVRGPVAQREGAMSRGRLVSQYLTQRAAPMEYCHTLLPNLDQYNGFNLIIGDEQRLCYLSSHPDGLHELSPGIYGLSNDRLDTPWPKVRKGKVMFERILERPMLSPDDLLRLLMDRRCPPDELLPDTGVGLRWERVLAPIFIASEFYGTRASTAILVANDGRVTFVERRYVLDRGHPRTSRFDFSLGC